MTRTKANTNTVTTSMDDSSALLSSNGSITDYRARAKLKKVGRQPKKLFSFKPKTAPAFVVKFNRDEGIRFVSDAKIPILEQTALNGVKPRFGFLTWIVQEYYAALKEKPQPFQGNEFDSGSEQTGMACSTDNFISFLCKQNIEDTYKDFSDFCLNNWKSAAFRKKRRDSDASAVKNLRQFNSEALFEHIDKRYIHAILLRCVLEEEKNQKRDEYIARGGQPDDEGHEYTTPDFFRYCEALDHVVKEHSLCWRIADKMDGLSIDVREQEQQLAKLNLPNPIVNGLDKLTLADVACHRDESIESELCLSLPEGLTTKSLEDDKAMTGISWPEFRSGVKEGTKEGTDEPLKLTPPFEKLREEYSNRWLPGIVTEIVGTVLGGAVAFSLAFAKVFAFTLPIIASGSSSFFILNLLLTGGAFTAAITAGVFAFMLGAVIGAVVTSPFAMTVAVAAHYKSKFYVYDEFIALKEEASQRIEVADDFFDNEENQVLLHKLVLMHTIKEQERPRQYNQQRLEFRGAMLDKAFDVLEQEIQSILSQRCIAGDIDTRVSDIERRVSDIESRLQQIAYQQGDTRYSSYTFRGNL